MIDWFFTARQAQNYATNFGRRFINEDLLKEIELRIKLAAIEEKSRLVLDKRADVVGTDFSQEAEFLRGKYYKVNYSTVNKEEVAKDGSKEQVEFIRIVISWREDGES